jgi:flagellin
MGMRINQNIAAMNSYRNLSVTEGQFSKSLEKLSSGFRINRAADDAAGLAISEKLRGQVSGLNQASANAQNGISLIQTAEGALNESHSILQRMRELAVQSSNDTNTEDDRKQIQKEVNQLSQELSRIGSTTEFNTKKLLDGSAAEKGLTFQIGANEGQSLNVKIGDSRGHELGVTGTVASSAMDAGTAASPATSGTATGTTAAVAPGDGNLVLSVDGGAAVTVALTAGGGGVPADTVASTVTKINSALGTTGSASVDASGILSITSATTGTTSSITVDASSTGTVLTNLGLTAGTSSGTDAVAAVAPAPVVITNNSVSSAVEGLQSGDYTVDSTGAVKDSSNTTVAQYDSASGEIRGLDADGNVDATKVMATTTAGTALAGTSFSVGGVDVSTAAAASSAITTIQSAIDKVSDQRSTLGAVQNRLDHTINNLGVAAENLAASESRIRDTDMAAEMMKFTRAQILTQAGTSMLAQANQAPQGVLSLLR